MRTLTEQAKIYWKKKEEEYGEKIHYRCMCKCSETSTGDQEAEWGILFFSDVHLYFQGFASQKSWKAFLFRKTGPGDEKGLFIRLGLEEVEFELLAGKNTWWERILSKPERSLFVNHLQTHNKKVQYHFILFRPDAVNVKAVIQKINKVS
jgi:hypothetical protein